MSSTYNGINVFPASITIPSDGDLADAGSVNISLEGLADRTTYLNNFITGTNPGAQLVSPSLINPNFVGVISFANPLIGDGSHLFLSQPGETTIILGNSIFSVGNTHRVDGIMQIANGGAFHSQSGSNFFFDGGSAINMSGTMSAFGRIIMTATGHITYRNGVAAATPASYSLSISDGDEFFVDPTTSNLVITILNAGANNGDRMRFNVINATNTTNVVSLAREDATSIIPFGSALTAGLRNAAGYWVCVDIIRRSGRWECSGHDLF